MQIKILHGEIHTQKPNPGLWKNKGPLVGTHRALTATLCIVYVNCTCCTKKKKRFVEAKLFVA